MRLFSHRNNGARRIGAAFTLIELLVVVAIIAVLMAILLPSLGRAREQAKTVKCAANLKQIGAAMYSYASENNGKLPPGKRTPTNTDKDTFFGMLWNAAGYADSSWSFDNNRVQNLTTPGYTQRLNVFNCSVTAALKEATPTVAGWYNSSSKMSYGYNYTNGQSVSVGEYRSINPSNFSPMRVVVLETSSPVFTINWPWPIDTYTGGLLPHSGGTNALFLDSHVEWRHFREIPKKINEWNIDKQDIFWKG